MNYLEARQRKDGRFDFTTMNDGHVQPTGYCHAYRPWTPEKVQRIGLPAEVAAKYEAEQAPFRDKYHADGHATAEEAERCYYEFELDHAKERRLGDEQRRCELCQDWTQGVLQIDGFEQHVLCDAHRNREGLAHVRPFEAGQRIIQS